MEIYNKPIINSIHSARNHPIPYEINLFPLKSSLTSINAYTEVRCKEIIFKVFYRIISMNAMFVNV